MDNAGLHNPLIRPAIGWECGIGVCALDSNAHISNSMKQLFDISVVYDLGMKS